MKVKGKVVSFILIIALCGLSVSLSIAAEITIRAGTIVPLKLDQTISSETATAGQTVKFIAIQDVTVDGVVVIKAGSDVVGEIAHSQKTGSFGKEGNLHLVVRHAIAVDNTRVPLRASLSQEGDERMALSFLICPFIKGTSSMIKAGTETKAYVDYDIRINVE